MTDHKPSSDADNLKRIDDYEVRTYICPGKLPTDEMLKQQTEVSKSTDILLWKISILEKMLKEQSLSLPPHINIQDGYIQLEKDIKKFEQSLTKTENSLDYLNFAEKSALLRTSIVSTEFTLVIALESISQNHPTFEDDFNQALNDPTNARRPLKIIYKLPSAKTPSKLLQFKKPKKLIP